MTAARTILSPDRLPDKGITLGNDQRKALEAKGLFPKRVPITERTHGYVEEEIDSYLESRITGECKDRSAFCQCQRNTNRRCIDGRGVTVSL
jgi:hypothetical protein